MTKILMTYEFENMDDVRAHLALLSRTDTAVVTTPTVTAPVETPETVEEVSRDALDGDGMPYNAAVHSDPPSFTNDGLWRAKRGAKAAADQARADFKAKGGGVTAPVVEAPTAAPAVAPTAPALPPAAPAPVTLEALYAKISEKITAVPGFDLNALYSKHCGSTDTVVVGQVLSTNESMRAAMFAELNA